MLPKINSSHGSETRNIINAAIDSINTQGKSIQDLVAEGQLTPHQYSELLTIINGLIKSGEVSREDFSEELIEEVEMKIDKGDVSVRDINKNKGLFDGTFFTSQFIEELNGGAINTTNVLDNSLTTQKYVNKSVTGEKIADRTIHNDHIALALTSPFTGHEATFPEGVSQYRPVKSTLDVSAIDIANKTIEVSFDYYIPEDTTTKITSFLWAQSSGEPRLSESASNLDAEIKSITNFSYQVQFAEDRDTLSLFIRPQVPNLERSLIYTKDIKVTIDGVAYGLDNISGEISGVLIRDVENLPEKLITQGDLEKVLPNAIAEASGKMLEGKTWMTFGDSITWYDKKTFATTHIESGDIVKGYQSYIEDAFGLTITNKGGSGYRLADNILGHIKSADYTDVDYVSITSGANDFRASKTIGSIESIGSEFDETTFYGAMQAGIEYILNQDPQIKIYLITPIPGWDEGKGKMPEGYPQAFRDVAELYGLPLCDWYHGSTINDITKSVYIGDGDSTGYDLHPTNAGYKRMGEVLVGTIKNNEL